MSTFALIIAILTYFICLYGFRILFTIIFVKAIARALEKGRGKKDGK